MRPTTSEGSVDLSVTFPSIAGARGGAVGRLRFDVICLVGLSAWVVASRAPYLNTFDLMGKDGPLYVNALKLDASYDVPMPGNIGYVVLGKLANLVLPNPVTAFLAVNIGLTAVGTMFAYLFAALIVSRPLAAAAAFAMSCNAMIWWHGGVIASYPVWLAVLPAIGWFGLRYQRDRRLGDMIGASVALGLGMMLRPDLLAFGTPLWLGSMLLGRAPVKHWLIGGAILAAACVCWFFGTAWVLGGIDVYLERVRLKHEGDKAGFSVSARGLFEGLLRNGVKYVLFLAWGSLLVIPPFVWGFAKSFRLANWRELALAALWVGPSWYFSFLIFAGNAGLIFPFLPLLYLGAAIGLQQLAGERRAVVGLAVLALLGALQFTLTPLLPQRDQRDVILNVTFLRYSGAGLTERYNHNLDDFGVSPALADVRRQMERPEPIPVNPH
ncbi:hypothetical protein [Paludisphaera borealis]|uniref:Glycosyltransferase RgtA/B/C/D-like domain-containing protein n=1 Tax=Paludisphaera borealis TaxID=1387353 RepID=A0A1U7CS00_9BACT|nr:hypothetical protein [Paludisphaera borealis]APW61653.1 hypothetical protein BSF38_03178 [Paludisphaera borealis]